MNWSFWIGTLSAALNVLFIADFVSYMVSGQSLAAFSFSTGSLSDLILQVHPGMTPEEFMIANGVLLGFSVLLLLLSIWIAYAAAGVISDDSSCACPRRSTTGRRRSS